MYSCLSKTLPQKRVKFHAEKRLLLLLRLFADDAVKQAFNASYPVNPGRISRSVIEQGSLTPGEPGASVSGNPFMQFWTGLPVAVPLIVS